MSQVGKQAALLDGIPVVQNATDRDTKYPSPDTNFRVHNLTSGYVEQYDGANWNPVVSTEKGGNQSNVKAYGAKGDGTTDDRGAFASADTAVQAQSVKSSLLIPAGTYKIGTNLTITSDVVFQPGAQLQPAAGVVVTFNGHVTAPLTQIVTTGAGTLSFATGSVPFFYPQWWGARGDNATDDSAAFNAAITAAGTAGGGTVYAAPASYKIGTGITASVNNVRLLGGGWRTILSKSTAGDCITWSASNQGVVIRDLAFSLGASAGWAINLNNCPASRIHNVQFVGGSSSAGHVTMTNNSHSTVVADCYSGSLIGTGIYADTSCGAMKIRDNRLDGLSQAAGSIGVRVNAPGSAITGNTIESLDIGLSLTDGANGLSITGNHFEANNIAIQGTNAGATNYGVGIRDNSFSETGTSACAIDLVNFLGGEISGNSFTSAHTTGTPIRTGNNINNTRFGPNTRAAGDTGYITQSVNLGLSCVRLEGCAYVTAVQPIAHPLVFGSAINVDATAGLTQTVTVTNNTAITFNNPSPVPDGNHTAEIIIEVYNNSGGVMGSVSFQSGYVLQGGAFTVPANGFRRWIKFFRSANALKWVELNRATADY